MAPDEVERFPYPLLGAPTWYSLLSAREDRFRFCKQLVEELLRSFLVPTVLHQDIEYLTVLIHRSPQIVTFARDRQKHLIEMPLATGSRAATQVIGLLLSTLAIPFANGLIGYNHATLTQ
jgi:hypothetical protein